MCEKEVRNELNHDERNYLILKKIEVIRQNIFNKTKKQINEDLLNLIDVWSRNCVFPA